MSYSAIEQLVTSEAYMNPEFRDPAWNTTPLERQDFLIAMQSIVHQIGNKLLNYHLVSDETSARIPTLILAAVQRRLEGKINYLNVSHEGKRSELENISHPRIDFVIGTKKYPMEGKFEFIKQHSERLRQKRVLFVTDITEWGVSVTQMMELFKRFDIQSDVVIVQLQGSFDHQFQMDKQHRWYVGDRFGVAGTAVWQSNEWTGVEKPKSDSPEFANKQSFPVIMKTADRKSILCIHRQIEQFADFLVTT